MSASVLCINCTPGGQPLPMGGVTDEPTHDCAIGQTTPGVLGGWTCPCPCQTKRPKITDAILDQWEQSATDDLVAGRDWQTHPVAILSLIQQYRAALAVARAVNKEKP